MAATTLAAAKRPAISSRSASASGLPKRQALIVSMPKVKKNVR